MLQDRKMDPHSNSEGIFSFLDTDLYKLTMQCAVLKYFPDVEVTYNFTNRTENMKLNRAAFQWLQEQITKLGNIKLSDDEFEYLRVSCPYLNQSYFDYLSNFRMRPDEHISLLFLPDYDHGADDDRGDVTLGVKGLWVETILYEIPLLALTSEAYFRFCDRDWSHTGQEDKAYRKGASLLEHGCVFSEFGTRRRRDYHTHELVMKGLCRAASESGKEGWKGKFTGTSNVHFARKFGVMPVGTVAHEWFMGIAAVTNDYPNANETALQYWVSCFGEGVLAISLTDTFGTVAFLEAFKKPIPSFTIAKAGRSATLAPTAASSTVLTTGQLRNTEPSIHDSITDTSENKGPRCNTDQKPKTYADVFTGVRQDSGDPGRFVHMMRQFYDSIGIKDKKTIVFSDSLNIDLCLEYMRTAEEVGFQATFGVGTFLTNDFAHTSTGKKSIPLNIVIKLSSAASRPAVKISDNVGKNTGDPHTIEEVKRTLGYKEMDWKGGDERTRWGKEDEESKTIATA